MNQNPEIEFYRTNAVHTVLKRYDFTNEQKQVIAAAILTAKKEKPNMLLIKKADQLLQEITAIQMVHGSELDKTEIAKGQARAAIVDSNRKRVRAESGRFGWSIEYVAVTAAAVLAIIYIYMRFAYPEDSAYKKQESQLHTLTEVQTYYHEQGKAFNDEPDIDEYNS
jgi:hypothetical protein